MDFDLQWLLLGLPIAFALGWLASRLDIRQLKGDQRETPKAYFKGLNLLLSSGHELSITCITKTDMPAHRQVRGIDLQFQTRSHNSFVFCCHCISQCA